MDRELICKILNSEMGLATGCTEPAAIALCAAYAREALAGDVAEIAVRASTNIIKNAMAAGIPGCSYTGVAYAAALGAIAGQTQRQLQAIDHATEEERKAAEELVAAGRVFLERKDTTEALYIEIELHSRSGHRAKAIIASTHANLVYLQADDEVRVDHPIGTRVKGVPADRIDAALSIGSIYEFVNGIDRNKDDLNIIDRAISVNMRISQEGENQTFNLHVGQNIAAMRHSGLYANDVVVRAMEAAACGIDARMGGANVPVVTNSGSGNQGITATVPIVVAADMWRIDEDRRFRAVTLSHLICIYIHCRFGLLSSLCGATIAATGVTCGLVYLMGGGCVELERAVNNMIGGVAGMLCDGAKADCALKVATCVNSAFICASMAMAGVGVQPNEGIVEKDAAKTVTNFVRLGNDGSPVMDSIVLDIMLNKGTMDA